MKKLISIITLMLLVMFVSSCGTKSIDDNESEEIMSGVIWAITPQYEHAFKFSSGLAIISNEKGKFQFIDKTGNTFCDLTFESINMYYSPSFEYGMAKILPHKAGDTYLISRSGVISNEPFMPVFEAMITNQGNGHNSIRIATSDNLRYGYINNQNVWFIKPIFEEVYGFSGGYSIAVQDGHYWYVDELGNITSKNKNPYFTRVSEGLAVAEEFGFGMYYVTMDGETTIEGPFESAKPFSEGYAAVRIDGKWGFIDKNGQLICTPQFSKVGDFFEGYAVVSIEGDFGIKTGVINTTGELTVSLGNIETYSWEVKNGLIDMGSFRNGFGLMDINGEWVVKPTYDDITSSENFFKLHKGDKLGGYFPTTQKTIKPQFDKIMFVSNDIAVIAKNEKYGLLNTKSGEIILDTTFFYLDQCSEGLILAKKNSENLYGYINTDGKWVLPPQFEDAHSFSEGVAAVKVDGKWGYIANPLIYKEWISDEISRGLLLGLFVIEDQLTLEKNASIQDLVDAIEFLLPKITTKNITNIEAELQIHERGVEVSNSVLTREDAAVIAASIIDICGENIYCLLAFLEDEYDIDVEKIQYVNYATSMGLFDFHENGYYCPKKEVSNRELYTLLLRIYEICLLR